MNTIQSKSTVKKIREENGGFMVAFAHHSGYFTVPANDKTATIKTKLRQAQQDNQELTFTYDKDLNILEIL